MRKKIGLALDGGGINGVAHLELIKRLESDGLAPSVVAGSSAGAIIAVLYADGGIERIDQFFELLSRKKILSPHNILIRGRERTFRRVEKVLNEVLRAKTFADLNLPFACMSANLMTGEAVAFTEGELLPAVMASSAVPGIFQPRLIDNEYYIDGVMADALPVKAVRDLGGEFVIGSILNNFQNISKDEVEQLSKSHVYNRSVKILRLREHDEQIAKCDYCFDFPFGDIPWHSFTSKDLSVQRAKEYLDKTMPKLLTILK